MSLATDYHLELLRSAPLDSWLAFSEDESRIVAVGKTYREAVEKGKAAGEDELVLFKTPPAWGPMAFVV